MPEENSINGTKGVKTTIVLFKLSIAATAVSMVGIVLLAWASPASRPEFTIHDPPTIALIVSWAGMWMSLLVCGVWSLLTLRGHRITAGDRFYRGNRVVYLVKLISADSTELTSSEKRLQLALQTLVLGTLIASLPLLMEIGIIGR